MPWTCRLLSWEEWFAPSVPRRVGDMVLAPESETQYLRLSQEYRRDWLGKRPPILVVLPGLFAFSPDEAYTDSPEGRGWTVTGEAPNITVSPSINCVGLYHGWLRNGEISEDVERRRFGQDGTLIRGG